MKPPKTEFIEWRVAMYEAQRSEAAREAFVEIWTPRMAKYGADAYGRPLPEPEDEPAVWDEPPGAAPAHNGSPRGPETLPVDTGWRLLNVAKLPRPEDIDHWDIEGVARPGTVVIVASPEGLGKSQVRKEIEWRCASGTGALFGHYAIPGRLVVASFDEENGDTEEWRRDEQVRLALGLEREAVDGYLFRVSFAGLDLTNLETQKRIRAEIEQVHADVAMFDTGTSMTGDEWGREVKAVMRFLHSLPCTCFVFVHMTKPKEENGKRGKVLEHGASLSDVMGHWTRAADSVATMSDLGDEGRVRWRMFKRVPKSSLVLKAENGLWVKVAEEESKQRKRTNDDRVLGAIAEGATTEDEVRTALSMARRTFFDTLGRLREDGLVEEGTPYALTDAGWEAVG